MSSKKTNVITKTGDLTLSFFGFLKLQTTFAGECTHSLIQAIKNPKSVRWKDTLYYMDMCGREAVPIVMLICFLMGLILGFQAAIQMHQFGTDIYVANLVGLSIVLELGPLMVGIICTGRAGSAFAAEIGTMKVNEEVDALYTMGHEPFRFLAFPKVIAMIAVMPLLIILGDIAGVFGGFVVGVFKLGLPTSAYINQTLNAIHYTDILESLFKGIVFAINIAFVGCLQGLQSKNDAQGVGRAATSAVVYGILFIIISDTLITVLLRLT
jgi:phospholipid/cholesterol/gamma-HCH transport system permease protein